MARKITLPLTEELAKTLHAGDQVLLTGTKHSPKVRIYRLIRRMQRSTM